MFKRLMVALGLVLLLAFATQTARADDPPGAKLYGTYCAGCHGAGGKGGFAPAIGDEKYLGTHDDAAITQATRDGIAGKGMPAWSKSNGGTLTDDQIDNIVAFLRSPTSIPSASAPNAAVTASSPVAQILPATDVVYAQTKLAMTQSQNADGAMVLVATLTKFDGSPVNGIVIAFTRRTTYGVVDLGTAKTDQQGRASLTMREQPEGARYITATFKGTPALGTSEAMIELERPAMAISTDDVNLSRVRLEISDEPLLAPEGSLITPNPPLVPTALFLLVVGGIWATYGFVVSQVFGIWKIGRRAPSENVLRMRRR